MTVPAEEKLGWCLDDDGAGTVVLYPQHDWAPWQDRPDHLPVQPDRHTVERLRWCRRCPKYEAERGGPTL